MSKETPWQNGYWSAQKSAQKMPSLIFLIDGENMSMKSLIALDYPDLEGGYECTIKSGNFGATRKEIAEATGADSYNVQIAWFKKLNTNGVINETGTEIQQWSETEKKIEIFQWLTPDEIEEMKKDRDDVNIPR